MTTGQGQADAITRIAVIEDDAYMRDLLCEFVRRREASDLSGAHETVDAARRAARAAPDIVLLDVHLNGASSIDAIPELRKLWPAAGLIMLSSSSDRDHVRTSIATGASAYVLKTDGPAALHQSIDVVRSGSLYVSPHVSRCLLEGDDDRTAVEPAGRQTVTPREVQILELLADGASYSRAAAAMGISINTARNYVRSLYEKIGVSSKAAAIKMAVRYGIIGRK